MKILGAISFLLALALASAFYARSASQDLSGTARGNGWWLANGVKGENSPEPLPFEMASVTRPGDDIRVRYLWNRDIPIHYEVYEAWRDDRKLLRTTAGAFGFYVILGSTSMVPIFVWLVVFVIAQLIGWRRKRAPQ